MSTQSVGEGVSERYGFMLLLPLHRLFRLSFVIPAIVVSTDSETFRLRLLNTFPSQLKLQSRRVCLPQHHAFIDSPLSSLWRVVIKRVHFCPYLSSPLPLNRIMSVMWNRRPAITLANLALTRRNRPPCHPCVHPCSCPACLLLLLFLFFLLFLLVLICVFFSLGSASSLLPHCLVS